MKGFVNAKGHILTSLEHLQVSSYFFSLSFQIACPLHFIFTPLQSSSSSSSSFFFSILTSQPYQLDDISFIFCSVLLVCPFVSGFPPSAMMRMRNGKERRSFKRFGFVILSFSSRQCPCPWIRTYNRGKEEEVKRQSACMCVCYVRYS
ncbi:MAG: hypothetical protein JOS17DRAFT_761792 [Linnemannia elongata]|nr:MAG: hypothetical protein JOS17DRAFT_761792 [Linnemannia elongata]